MLVEDPVESEFRGQLSTQSNVVYSVAENLEFCRQELESAVDLFEHSNVEAALLKLELVSKLTTYSDDRRADWLKTEHLYVDAEFKRSVCFSAVGKTSPALEAIQSAFSHLEYLKGCGSKSTHPGNYLSSSNALEESIDAARTALLAPSTMPSSEEKKIWEELLHFERNGKAAKRVFKNRWPKTRS